MRITGFRLRACRNDRISVSDFDIRISNLHKEDPVKRFKQHTSNLTALFIFAALFMLIAGCSQEPPETTTEVGKVQGEAKHPESGEVKKKENDYGRN